VPFDVLASAVVGTAALQRSGLLPQFNGSVTYHRPAPSPIPPVPARLSSASPSPAPYYQALAQTANDALYDFLAPRAPQYVRYNGLAFDETERREYYPDGNLRSVTTHRRVAGPSLDIWY
jgi:hypothetical protein